MTMEQLHRLPNGHWVLPSQIVGVLPTMDTREIARDLRTGLDVPFGNAPRCIVRLPDGTDSEISCSDIAEAQTLACEIAATANASRSVIGFRQDRVRDLKKALSTCKDIFDEITGCERARRHGGPAPEDLRELDKALSEATSRACAGITVAAEALEAAEADHA